MSNFVWVDPPSGWKYGFPKLWNGEGKSIDWMIKQGYPENEIKSYGDHFYTRHWQPSEDEILKYGVIDNK